MKETDASNEQRREHTDAILHRASTLNDGSIRLRREGKAEEAQRASREAVDLYREVNDQGDRGTRWHLATALITHSSNVAASEGMPGLTVTSIDDDVLSIGAGYTNESLLTAKEGIELLAQLYDEAPARYRLDMVRALWSYALRLAQYRFRDRALRSAELGCRVSDGLEWSVPALVERSKAHLIWSKLLAESSQPEAALTAANIAASGFEVLMERAPDEYAAWYAKAAQLGATALEAQGHHDEAMAKVDEVIEYRLAGNDGLPPRYDASMDELMALYLRVHTALEGPRSPRADAARVLSTIGANEPTQAFESLLRPDKAEELWQVAKLRAGLARCRNNESAEAQCLSWMAVAAVMGGRYELAIDPATRAVELARRSGDASREAFALVYLGNAFRGLDRLVEAANALGTALQRFPGGEYGRIHAVALISLAEVSERLAQSHHALDLYRSAAEVAKGLRISDIEASANDGITRLSS